MHSNRIILSFKYDFFQRTSFFLFSCIPLVLVIQLLVNSINVLGALVVLFFLFFLVAMLSLALLKKGFLVKNKELYKGYFVLGKQLFKQKINLTDRTIVAVLKNKQHKRISTNTKEIKYKNFEINVLDKKQTKRDVLLVLKNEQKANEGVLFLTKNTDLKIKKLE